MNLSQIIKKHRHDPADDFRIVRTWKEYTDDRKYMKYLMYELEMMEENGNNGIEISYNRFGAPTWEMCSTNSRFITYQGVIPIKDITDLDNNVALFKKEYPAVLKAELDAMLKTIRMTVVSKKICVCSRDCSVASKRKGE